MAWVSKFYDFLYTCQEKVAEKCAKLRSVSRRKLQSGPVNIWLRINGKVIWDIFWGQMDPFPMLYRYHITLRQKDRDLKKVIFRHFFLFTDTCIKQCKVNSKDFAHKWKKWGKKICEFVLFPILFQCWWLEYEKVSILTRLKPYNNVFLISEDLSSLCCFEHSPCISLQKWLKVHFFRKNGKFEF